MNNESPTPMPASPERLAEAVRLLGEAYRPERIYLFGSWARGDAGPDSDLDLLVVVPDDAEPARKQSRLAYETLWKTGASGDILVWTHGRFDACLHLPASLPATVVREGRLVYRESATDRPASAHGS